MMECIKEFMESGSDEHKTELSSYIARKCLANQARDLLGKCYTVDISKESPEILIKRMMKEQKIEAEIVVIDPPKTPEITPTVIAIDEPSPAKTFTD